MTESGSERGVRPARAAERVGAQGHRTPDAPYKGKRRISCGCGWAPCRPDISPLLGRLEKKPREPRRKDNA
jgi:hypothetical protein